MGKEDSMSVTGHRGSRVSWGGGSGKGNNGGGHKNRNRGPSNPSTTVAYYRDGVPYNAAGEIIITITGGPKLPPGVPSPAPGNYQVPTNGGFVYEVAVNRVNIITGVTVYPVTNNRGYALVNEDKRKNLARTVVDKILAPKRAAAEEARLAAEEAERKIEAAKVQAKWDSAHPIEVAESQVNEVQQRINQVQQNKLAAEQLAAIHDATANSLQNEVSPLLAEARRLRAEFENQAKEGALDPSGHPPAYHRALAINAAAARKKWAADEKQAEANREREKATQARNQANEASQRLNQMRQEKIKAEAHQNAVRQKVAEDIKAKEESDTVKDAVKFTADFYKELTSKYGDNASQIAQELAKAAKGKQIRNVDDALKAFDKYKDVLNKKFSLKDREAIAQALESFDRDLMAKNLAKFSKAFNYVGNTVDIYDVVIELIKAIKTNIWRPFFVKVESMAAGRAAAIITAFAFSIIIGMPIGILGFALIMASVSMLVNDELMEEINKLIGI
ncbi:Colicin-Ia [Yersinia intermedia]|uniref:Colicin-Ia n=1 Tax=Yersinia intermedia TaxID=631 RepID=A0A0H5M947_YERIN|nr:colicin-like pore-forming protein [Yersinia intermedia]CRY53586.1 Colicin-Ia [Yersinia intermedia]